MKNIFLTFFLAAAGFAATAQDDNKAAATDDDIAGSEVPAAVMDAFKAKFADAADIEWELKGDLYKAEFDMGKREHDVWIDQSGKITRHNEDIPKSQLPDAIREKVKSEFTGYDIDDVDKVDMDGKTYFQVDLDGDNDDREVLFTAEGTVESNEADTDDDN